MSNGISRPRYRKAEGNRKPSQSEIITRLRSQVDFWEYKAKEYESANDGWKQHALAVEAAMFKQLAAAEATAATKDEEIQALRSRLKMHPVYRYLYSGDGSGGHANQGLSKARIEVEVDFAKGAGTSQNSHSRGMTVLLVIDQDKGSLEYHHPGTTVSHGRIVDIR